MAWKLPSSLRRASARSVSHQLIFKSQEVKNPDQSKIIGLTITRPNVNKNLGFLHEKDNIDQKSNQEEY